MRRFFSLVLVVVWLCLAIAPTCQAQTAATQGDPPPKAGPLPKLQFRAILFTSTRGMGLDAAGSYGDFELGGPKLNTLRPLPQRIRHVAYDPEGKQLYGIASQEVFRIDLDKKSATEMKLPKDVPELSWPCGLAFDSKRGRLILVSLGGVGHIYAYSPKADKWSLVADMNNLDLAALTYDANQDCLYGLYVGRKGPTLGMFNPLGALIHTVGLQGPAVPKEMELRGAVGCPIQLIASGDHLILITEAQILLINPGTGDAIVTWKR